MLCSQFSTIIYKWESVSLNLCICGSRSLSGVTVGSKFPSNSLKNPGILIFPTTPFPLNLPGCSGDHRTVSGTSHILGEFKAICIVIHFPILLPQELFKLGQAERGELDHGYLIFFKAEWNLNLNLPSLVQQLYHCSALHLIFLVPWLTMSMNKMTRRERVL